MNKKSWSKDALTVDSFEQLGYKVQKSRLDGDMQVFMDGRPVALLFKSKTEAAEWIGL
jgi:hypothetical protein